MNGYLYAVIGNPIEHSLSPLIHEAFANETHESIRCEKLLAPLHGFQSIVEDFFSDGGCGLNVTAPFKNDAFKWVDKHDHSAEIPRAVNTIARDGSTFIGYNTDGIGFINDLLRLQWQVTGQNVLILGAGGAAQGIIEPLLRANAKVTVVNRTSSKSADLKSQFPAIETMLLQQVEPEWHVVVNATSSQRFEGDFALDPEVFRNAFCYDLNYRQTGFTPFIQYVQSTAKTTADGLGMLVEQAAAAFRIWRGVKPSTQWVLYRLRKPKRQFIAGATCSKCKSIDCVYVELDLLDRATVRGCVECGFVEKPDGTQSVGVI